QERGHGIATAHGALLGLIGAGHRDTLAGAGRRGSDRPWRAPGTARATAFVSTAAPLSHPGRGLRRSELAVVPFLEGVEQVGGGVGLAVVLDLLVALDL